MKRIIPFLLVIILIAMMPSAAAKSILTYGDWAVTFVGGVVTQFSVEYCNSTDADITVPASFDGVRIVKLNANCFANNKTMQTVTLSSNVKTIENYAFLNADSLDTVVLTDAVSEIGVGAFSGTAALQSINLEDSAVTSVNDYMFLNSGISRIALPLSCVSVSNSAFANCANLIAIEIPDSVTQIDENAFVNSDNVVIYAKGESYAIEYAIANGIDYVITDAAAEVTFMLGDADGDNNITILDATKIQRVLAGLTADEDGMIALRGDSNSDGLDILDATRIQRYLAAFDAEPVGEIVTVTIPAV